MALSKDLRQRVVTAYHDGEGTYSEIAARFGVSRNTVWSWVKLERETGSLAPRTANNGRPEKLSKQEQQLLLQMARNDPNAFHYTLAESLFKATGTKIDPTAVGRYLRKAGLTPRQRQLWRRNNDPIDLSTLCEVRVPYSKRRVSEKS